jgi:hypothetical protein
VITIVLPFPDLSKCSIHNKGHWRTKSEYTKELRMVSCFEALRRNGVIPNSQIDRASIQYRFYVADRKRRDAANLVQACKPYVDGIVDAGLIAGDHWEALQIAVVSVEVDKKNPRVELIISEV